MAARFLALIFALALLGGCATSTDTSYYNKRDERTASPAWAKTKANLPALKKAYENNTEKLRNARLYAYGLYDNGDYKESTKVLAPFLKQKDGDALSADDLFFYTQALLKQDKTDEAIPLLRKVLSKETAHAAARLELGKILEERELYADAETLYTEAIEADWLKSYSSEDKVRLDLAYALNLAQQEHFLDAYDVLSKAKADHPNNREIERHLRIVRAMTQSNGHSAPKPVRRP